MSADFWFAIFLMVLCFFAGVITGWIVRNNSRKRERAEEGMRALNRDMIDGMFGLDRTRATLACYRDALSPEQVKNVEAWLDERVIEEDGKRLRNNNEPAWSSPFTGIGAVTAGIGAVTDYMPAKRLRGGK